MAAELPRPGVEVVQVIRSASPTVTTPTLVPSIVGVCRQIVDLLESDGSGGQDLNGDALIQLPAFFLAKAGVGDPPSYGGLDGLLLIFSANNGAAVTVPFADNGGVGLSPASVVEQVNLALGSAGITSVRAETVGSAWRLRTLGVGAFQSLYVSPDSSPALLDAFGLGAGRTYTGLSSYNQLSTQIPTTNFPDPRGNLEELSIEAASVRVFLALSSTNFVEVLRDESFLRNGEVNSAAVLTGTADLGGLSLPGDVENLTLIISSVDGDGDEQTVTFTSGATTPALVVSQINSGTSGLVASLDGSDQLVLTSDTGGPDSELTLGAGTANTVLGFTNGQSAGGAAVEVMDDGNGDNFSPLLQFLGQDFTAQGTSATVTGNVAINGLVYPDDLEGKTLELSDGGPPQTVTFSDALASASDVLAEILAVVGAGTGGTVEAVLDLNNQLVLSTEGEGSDGVLHVIGGTALATLGLSVTSVYGAGGLVLPGDELFVDGQSVGIITAVAPGGQVDVLKLDNQKVLSSNFGRHFHIMAKGLGTPQGGRPQPDLMVDGGGNATIKHTRFRDTNGGAISRQAAQAPIYLTYSAIRRDVTAAAANPGLLRFDGQAQLLDTLAPIDARNPLGLGLFFAIANAPGVQVTGLGVDAISADSEFGTPEAFARAAEFLEAYEVYALAPMTHDNTVGQIFNSHVSFMSDPEQKGERIALFNSAQPTHKLDTLVASGAAGNSVGSSGLQFDTGVPNLSALLLNLGINPVGTIESSSGLFLDIASDAKNYSIASVNGSIVTIRTTHTPGTNDDSFYAESALNEDPLPALLVNEAFAVRVRGVALVTPAGQPDKNLIAETIQQVSQTFGNRRFWHVVPDRCAATVEGIEQVLPGFYMCAGIAGMIGHQPPQQSFTNFPMTGYTRVLGSNGFFSEKQLNVMAAGGTYIVVQDAPSAPLIARMALTTDMSSVDTRTDSITKVVDFVAKFLRRGVKNFIGRFNVTQSLLDMLGATVEGLGTFLVESGILIGFSQNNIIQDEDAPDTVLLDVTLDVPYPCNYIKLTLVI